MRASAWRMPAWSFTFSSAATVNQQPSKIRFLRHFDTPGNVKVAYINSFRTCIKPKVVQVIAGKDFLPKQVEELPYQIAAGLNMAMCF